MASVYVTYQPDLAFPGAANCVRSFASLAVERGWRLVLLSGRNEEGAQRGEQYVRDSGAEWTLVRSSFLLHLRQTANPPAGGRLLKSKSYLRVFDASRLLPVVRRD